MLSTSVGHSMARRTRFSKSVQSNPQPQARQSTCHLPLFPEGWLGSYGLKPTIATPEDRILDKCLDAMGLTSCTKTDPKLMRELMAETRLDQLKTTYPPLERTLKAAMTEPQELSRMIGHIRHGLKNNAAVMAFLKAGLEKGFFQKSEFNSKALHMAFLLETLTFSAVNNTKALAEIEDHFMSERQKNGFHPGKAIDTFIRLLAVYHNIFEPMKAMSIDPAVATFRLPRENEGKPLTVHDLDQLLKQGKITFIDKAAILSQNPKPGMANAGLHLNILEAGITEFNQGFTDNALVAYALNRCSEKPSTNGMPQGPVLPISDTPENHPADALDPANFHPTANFSKEWVDLYESWNMAFVVSQLDDLHLILPKLFIPSQIDCKPEEYLFNRTMALNNVVNFNLFRKLDHVVAVPAPENRRDIAQTWGAINKQHALDYVQKELGIAPADFEKEFEAYFKNRLYHFGKLAFKFIRG